MLYTLLPGKRKLTHLKAYEFNQIKGLVNELMTYYKTINYINYALIIKEKLLKIQAILTEHEIDNKNLIDNLADKRISPYHLIAH